MTDRQVLARGNDFERLPKSPADNGIEKSNVCGR